MIKNYSCTIIAEMFNLFFRSCYRATVIKKIIMDDKFEVKKESLDNENFDVLKQEENKIKLEDDKEEEENEEEIIDSDVERDKMIKIKHDKTNKKEDEEEEEDEEIYCICKTSDIDRFMM